MTTYENLKDTLTTDAFEKEFQGENFEEIFEGCDTGLQGFSEGQVVKGTVVSINDEYVVIDTGLKSEGRVSRHEFESLIRDGNLEIGSLVDVFIERLEDRNGELILSHEKARLESVWDNLEKSTEAKEPVMGVMFTRVKGGFTVDLGGAVAFLPGSQVDIRPIKDVIALMNIPQPFLILKMDRIRENIIVSRRAVLEESRAETKTELVSSMEEGRVLEGVVKNITDYGAFVDLGGVDGLLHVTDISWRRINHPGDVLKVGDIINVKVTKFNKETSRISLGMKQLEEDPWKKVENTYEKGSIHKGIVTNITDYGAFVELSSGIEGLVHVSEMSWTKKNVHPGKIVATSQEVEVKVLESDGEKRRLSLGMKQVYENPWESFSKLNSVGTKLEGEIRNITEFGMFVALNEDIDGMIHISDLSWEKTGEESIKEYKPGQLITVKILDIDPEKERISLGVKQLTSDTVGESIGQLKKDQIVTCTISKVQENGLEVKLLEGKMTSFIRRSDLARERSEQRTDRFAVGEKVDALVTAIDKKDRRVSLSIKGREIKEEKKAMEEYGSSDSGASLGDILGAALEKAKEDSEEAKPKENPTAKAKKEAKPKEKPAAKAKKEAKPKENPTAKVKKEAKPKEKKKD